MRMVVVVVMIVMIVIVMLVIVLLDDPCGVTAAPTACSGRLRLRASRRKPLPLTQISRAPTSAISA